MHAYRTHTCGALTIADAGNEVRVSGWVHRKRDHGDLVFIDLRDHYGMVQIVTEVDGPVFQVIEEGLLALAALEDMTGLTLVPTSEKPDGHGWHGNALLVRRGIDIIEGEALDLPTLEPRGAACGEIVVEGCRLRVIGTHLDLSGLRRRDQIRSLLRFVEHCPGDLPTVIMGDFNQWGRQTGAMREFADGWQIITPGRSYPSRQPVATLDRIVASRHWNCVAAEVHHTGLAAVASDHLPITAVLELPK